MFLKQVKVKGKPYYCIVKSVRINGKPRHKHVKYVGSKEAVIKKLLMGDEAVMEAMKVSQIKDHGEVDLLLRIAEKLDLRDIINRHVVKTAGVDVGSQMVILAINQCLDALALDNVDLWYHHTILEEQLGIPFYKLNVENLCKAMDYIYEPIRGGDRVIDTRDNAKPIQQTIVEKLKGLYDIKLDTLFYDITSTYFEGNGCIIARLGYSRDGKRDKKQILIGLVVTRDYRFPIFYSIFEGSTSDMATVSWTLKTLQKEFKVEKTLLVFDRGMVRPENLKELDESGFDYICGLKKGEKAVKEVILKARGLDEEKNKVRKDINAVELVKEFAGRKRKLVVYKNHEQARAVTEDRDMKLAKAMKSLEEYAAKVNAGNYRKVEKVVARVREHKRGVSKYIWTGITIEEDRVRLSVKRRDDKVEVAEKLDGKYLLMCTDFGLRKEEVVSAYFDKDGIEKVFRSMKQHGLRPMRSWTLNRVKASIFVGYLGQLLLATLGYMLDKAGLKITPERALGYLKWQKKVVLESGKTVVEKISVLEVEAREILEKLESAKLL